MGCASTKEKKSFPVSQQASGPPACLPEPRIEDSVSEAEFESDMSELPEDVQDELDAELAAAAGELHEDTLQDSIR